MLDGIGNDTRIVDSQSDLFALVLRIERHRGAPGTGFQGVFDHIFHNSASQVRVGHDIDVRRFAQDNLSSSCNFMAFVHFLDGFEQTPHGYENRTCYKLPRFRGEQLALLSNRFHQTFAKVLQ